MLWRLLRPIKAPKSCLDTIESQLLFWVLLLQHPPWMWRDMTTGQVRIDYTVGWWHAKRESRCDKSIDYYRLVTIFIWTGKSNHIQYWPIFWHVPHNLSSRVQPMGVPPLIFSNQWNKARSADVLDTKLLQTHNGFLWIKGVDLDPHHPLSSMVITRR